MKSSIYGILLLALGALLINGCAGGSLGRDPAADAASAANAAAAAEAMNGIEPNEIQVAKVGGYDGSLFDASASSWSLYRDVTAHRRGDIVTIRVTINNSASGTASTDVSRASDIEAGVTSLFGYETKSPGLGSTDPLNATSPGQLIKSNSASSFKGEGDTLRSGRIVANISAVVTHVYPNGNLRVQGSQSTLINNEDSLLTVEGIIRPYDITTDNVVLSERLANARIEFSGRGVLSDKQRPGILMRAFDWVWTF